MADWGEKVTGKYKIKAGDNLTSISSALGIPVDSLQLYNNIENPNKIKVGQELLWRRDPSFGENLLRWVFESDEDTQKSRDINNVIQNTITLSAQPKKIESLSFEDFIEDLRISENPKKLGYRNGRWWPFETANGNIDVGYGIDLGKQTPEYRARVTKYGLSDDELREDLLERFNTYQDNMKKLFQKNGIDITKVPIKYQRGVLDMLHHLGYTGMSEYKNFFNGIRTNDLDTIRKEAKTTFKNKSGKRQVDMKRYNFRLNRYFNNLELGGRFTFKKNSLVKKAKEENKRDMRKKLVKSDIPNSTRNKAKKYQAGGELVDLPNILGIRDGSWNIGGQSLIGAGIKPIFVEDGIKVPEIKVDPSIFTSWNSIHSDLVIPEVEYSPNEPIIESIPGIFEFSKDKKKSNKEEPTKIEYTLSSPKITGNKKPTIYSIAIPSKGESAFDKAFDEVIKEDPSAAKYRPFLTTVAKYESGFNPTIKNPNAPAYGYFQFMQDGIKYNNISAYAGTDIGTFLKDPKLQIKAAINLAKSMESGFSKQDIEAAAKQGITHWGLLGGAWLGGVGGVRKLLHNNVNVDDKHWGGAGIDMKNQIKRYNFDDTKKYQEGGTLIFGNPETSEMLTYKMKDGSLKTIPNPGAGFVSGTDPIGQVIVEGAVLNKPLGWLSSKAINWAKNLLKNKSAVGNFTSSSSDEVAKNAERIIKKEDLPSYAKPNWQGDALELTKDRLRNGGFDRLENNSKGTIKYSEKHKKNILQSRPANISAESLLMDPITIGMGIRGASKNNFHIWGVFKDAPKLYKTGQPYSDMSAHEFSHWVYKSIPEIDKSVYESVIKKIDDEKLYKYLSDPDEWLARGSQIKNYFGLKEGEELTGDMLRFASQNMIKDRGYDNNLSYFFAGIKDFDKMAEYLNKYSLATTPLMLMNSNE